MERRMGGAGAVREAELKAEEAAVQESEGPAAAEPHRSTPLMAQYHAVKKAHPDCLLFGISVHLL